jgi:hypothetical protein
LRVRGLFRYPVKSLRGKALERSTVDRIGLAGDRHWLVVDRDNRFLTIRQEPAMTQVDVDVTETGIVLRHEKFGEAAVSLPGKDAETLLVTVWRDTVPALLAGPAGAELLSSVIGREVRLVHMSEPESRPVDARFGLPGDFTSFSDAFPLLLTTTVSLDDLNHRLEDAIEMARFRPNIVVDGDAAWGEDSWKTIRIRDAIFRIAKPCGRCVVTTRDPRTGKQIDPTEPLATLGRFHRAADGAIIFGQNLIPEALGEIRIGDPVEIIEAGPSNLC